MCTTSKADLMAMESENRSWRRISTGKLNILYSEKKVIPNHQRSKSASCHDICKFGRKYESEDNPRSISHKKRVRNMNLSFDSSLMQRALIKSGINRSFGYESDSLADSKMGLKSSSSRTKDMAEQKKRVTALKLKSVAETAAMALRRSTVNRKKINDSKEPLRKRVPEIFQSLKTKKTEKSRDLIEEKTLYVIESDQIEKVVIESPLPLLKAVKEAEDEADKESVEQEEVEEEEDEHMKKSKVFLLNNVIEETAKKLVEARKSKVEALVGAFESVIISMQQINSSATT